MSSHTKSLHISNFKSIRELHLEDCRRINVFVGKPNTGKSNILEALAMLANPSFAGTKEIRFESTSDLIIENERSLGVIIETDQEHFNFKHDKQTSFYTGELSTEEGRAVLSNNNVKLINEKPKVKMLEDGALHGSSDVFMIGNIKYYRYTNIHDILKDGVLQKQFDYLVPPFGKNLFNILDINKSIQEQVAGWFEAYGLDLLLDKKTAAIYVQKKKGRVAYNLPFSLTSDTLLRSIFYYAAIKSNTDSILVFEEPEVHSYPPYIQMLAQTMADSTTNQFFIATHSPYLLSTLIEETPQADLRIYLTHYIDYETKVEALSDDDIQDVVENNIDLFFNIERYSKLHANSR